MLKEGKTSEGIGRLEDKRRRNNGRRTGRKEKEERNHKVRFQKKDLCSLVESILKRRGVEKLKE